MRPKNPDTSMVYYRCSTEAAPLPGGEFQLDSAWVKFYEIENFVFQKIDPSATRLSIRFTRPDGSGRYATYYRRGSVWRMQSGDNIVASWYPILFFALAFGLPVIGFIVCWILGIK